MENKSDVVAHRRMPGLIKLVLMVMVALPSAVHVPTGDKAYATDARSKVSAAFQNCATGTRQACVVDGDTIWLDGQKIRIADIDTPEVSEPRCSSELALGNRATDRMLELINEGPFELRGWPGRDTDRYGRKLRVLVRDGRSLGNILVSEGLARTWSGRREPWC
ncbi:thermonuclease family protein [Rhizobium bangladeshense]|uniref:thermonuclease family protein n=1 Tax=Rhizobium bangladeshense TaxID=1138189 RepID=UPI002180A5D6|nr:thermonuclease family protein [Rhizobium bangladeshense]